MDANTHGTIKNINDTLKIQCKLPGHKNCGMWVHTTKTRPIRVIYKHCCKWIIDGFVLHENAATHDLKRQLTEKDLGMKSRKA